MDIKRTLLFIFCGISFFLFSTNAIAELAERESLGLTGCAMSDVEISEDGSLTLVGCEGPKGLYYSLDFGDTWIFAEAGDYTAGSATSIGINTNGAYAVVDSSILKTDLPTSVSWTPIWSELTDSGLQNVPNARLFKSGTNYFVLSNVGITLKVLDTTTDTLSHTITLPDGGSNIAIGSSYIYLLTGIIGEPSTLYRAGFDPSTAQLTSSWSDISAGLPGNSYFWSVFVAPNTDKVFVGVRALGSQITDTLYVSENNGTSFSDTGLSQVPNSACFNESVYIIANNVSYDDGVTWAQPASPASTGDVGFEDQACAIDPSNSDKAMMGTNRGPSKTENLVSGTPALWTEAVTGLESVVVRAMSQSETNDDRVVLGTSAGVALSNDFTAEETTWLFPVCPGGDCVGGSRIVVDPSDEDSLFYGSGNIRKGTVDTSGETPSITWVDLASLPGNFWFFTSMSMYDFLPQRLYASYMRQEGEINGGIYYYDTSDGTPHAVEDTDVAGNPISAFIALSADVMFAGRYSSDVSSEIFAVLESRDGGVAWDVVTDAGLPEKIYVQDFAYDQDNDILYAGANQVGDGEATVNGGIYILADALAGTGSWQAPTRGFEGDGGNPVQNISITAVAVDPNSGDVYASSGNQLWRSTDSGDSWTLFYTGLTSETTNVLLFDAEESEGEVSVQAVATRSRLAQGANTGLYQFDTSNLSDNSSGLESPVYVLWNGFLSMVNILELVNKGASALSVTVTLYDISGMQVSQSTVQVSATSQQDLILNDMQGFSGDSYGIAKLTFSGTDLDGRLAFYRYAADMQNYEFAFYVPFVDTLSGASAVGFNTFQPSLNPVEAGDLVTQWLSIVNLDTATAKSFNVKRYDPDGMLIASADISVNPFSRVDIEGGHGTPGPSNVGLNVITPTDIQSPYLAHLVRYGERTAASAVLPRATNYAFAFPLLADAGSGSDLWVSVSNGAGAENWVEVANAGANSASVTVAIYDNSGVVQDTQSFTLAAYAQRHIYATGSLGVGVTGAAKITPGSSSAKIIAQSMYYFRDSTGSIEAMYGSQADSVASGEKTGSYNLFLGMYNWLRLFNTSSTQQTLSFDIVGAGGIVTEKTVTLNANSGTDLGLHETTTYGTAVNSYGVFSVNGPVVSELLRIRPTSSGGIDFAAPTRVR